ncbi:helix-turn-helix domain-containing protein [Streptomyces lavendulae]|uniref:helix-turn-helix domain-containing protein n=1 Tax=Streptomyces lavendulae TaxID=1914 RepID=UPI0033E77836
MDIGDLIRELRTAHGWSQAHLADKINTRQGTTLTREYIARWERGKVAPRGFYLAALSSVLDVPLACPLWSDLERCLERNRSSGSSPDVDTAFI